MEEKTLLYRLDKLVEQSKKEEGDKEKLRKNIMSNAIRHFFLKEIEDAAMEGKRQKHFVFPKIIGYKMNGERYEMKLDQSYIIEFAKKTGLKYAPMSNFDGTLYWPKPGEKKGK